LLDHRIARDWTLTDAPQHDTQIVRTIEQDCQSRLHDRRRVAAARREIERQRFRMFRVRERMKRAFDFSACCARITLRPRRQISSAARVEGCKQNDRNNRNPRGY
jgi:hypothetical protein